MSPTAGNALRRGFSADGDTFCAGSCAASSAVKFPLFPVMILSVSSVKDNQFAANIGYPAVLSRNFAAKSPPKSPPMPKTQIFRRMFCRFTENIYFCVVYEPITQYNPQRFPEIFRGGDFCSGHSTDNGRFTILTQIILKSLKSLRSLKSSRTLKIFSL